MTQAPPSIFARLWRWGVLPIIIGAVLLYVAQKIAPWFPGRPDLLVTGTVLGFYLGYLARTLRALLIGLNGGALCGLGLQRMLEAMVVTWSEAFREAWDADANFLETYELIYNDYSILSAELYVMLGLLSAFFRRGRVYVINGCVRGLLAGLLCWISSRTLFWVYPNFYISHFELLFLTIQSLALIPLLLFSPLLKPPVDEINQPVPAAHQKEDHGR